MPLSAEQMAAMSRLLDEALPLDAAGRERWLQGLEPQHRELEAALRHALLGDAPGLDTGPRIVAGEPVVAAGGMEPGQRVGPYQLVRLLGAGGMAQVWLAQRADGAYQREVALKLPATVLRQDLASRFARERDILASLEHTNIARLYDAGVSSQGQPYLAMEFVAGQPLVSWCDAHRLGVRERLRLFLQVLDAVQYAHAQGVIHRDLKPSNILVTEFGQVRLLDFGVAKLLAQDEASTQLTQLYGQALTPQYASPEQLLGEEVSAASDVYSLGVLLYELLAGALPYRVKAGASAAVLQQAVGTTQVDRPSTRVDEEAAQARSASAVQLTRRLQGDLDAIVLKALAKEPTERYGSATALAEDLRRHLTGEPVQARPDTPVYRLSKFVQRHRVGVAANAVATVLVIVAAGYEVKQHRSVPASSPAAVAAVTPASTLLPAATVAADDKSIAVLPFVDMSEKHDQEYFSDGLSEELIDRLAHSADLKVISRTSSFYFKGKQVTAGEIARTLGVAHLLEGSVRKSGNELRITAQLIRAADGSHLWSQTYDRRLADIFKIQDEIARTVAAALSAAMNSRVMQQQGTTNVDAYNSLLKGNFFFSRSQTGDSERALSRFEEATRLDPNFAIAWSRIAAVYWWLGYFGRIPVPEARTKALIALNRALAIDPNLSRAHVVLAGIYRDFDWDWKAASNELRRATELDPGNSSLQSDLGYLNWIRSGDISVEIAALRQELLQNPLDTNDLWALGVSYWASGRYAESEAAYAKLLELNPTYETASAMYARALLFEGKLDSSLAAAAHESNENERLSVIPCIYWKLGRRAESDAALRDLKSKYGALSANNVAENHACRGETDAAFEWLDRAYNQHQIGIENVKFDPYFSAIRNDSRFRSLLAKLNLAD